MEVIIGSKKLSIAIAHDHEKFLELIKLLHQADSLNNFIKELRVYPEWREEIQKTEFIRAIHGTVAIEGTDVNLDQVEKLVGDRTLTEANNAEKEVTNALKAYEFIIEWATKNRGESISEPVIKQIHTVITRDLDYYLNMPGQYRNQPVSFGNPRRQSMITNSFEIESSMKNLVDFINSTDPDPLMSAFPIIKAIISHYLITLIHPFIDGNGRVARAVEALVFHHYGKFEPYCFTLNANYYYRNRGKYFELLRYTDDTVDYISFLIFALQGLVEHLTSIKTNLLEKTTHTLILDYIHQLRRSKKILKRQSTLMEIVFQLGEMELSKFWNEPAIRGLFHNVSDSTRKRDIKNLLLLDLLKIKKYSDDGKPRTIIYANWDVLSTLTLRLDTIPHRPCIVQDEKQTKSN